jgi:DNA-binding response OmpR family regulator
VHLAGILPRGRKFTVQESYANNNTKTILLAEDEEMLRDALRRILERAGFLLLVAEDAQEALRTAGQYADRIDLLVSNVRLPGMSGSVLATTLSHSRPDLRILLVSGYPLGMLTLPKEWSFLQKPFTTNVLLGRVYEILRLRPQAHTADNQGRPS